MPKKRRCLPSFLCFATRFGFSLGSWIAGSVFRETRPKRREIRERLNRQSAIPNYPKKICNVGESVHHHLLLGGVCGAFFFFSFFFCFFSIRCVLRGFCDVDRKRITRQKVIFQEKKLGGLGYPVLCLLIVVVVGTTAFSEEEGGGGAREERGREVNYQP